ncbi:MAG: class I SAM-dependent methyltransferase [Candidatus Eiseniibacteriota bacterium]
MTCTLDDPPPGGRALGETHGGARNLPRFLCSLLGPGPVLVVGSSQVALEAAATREVVVVDPDHRRLSDVQDRVSRHGGHLRAICKDLERQDLGVAPRSMANVVCVDVLERTRDDIAVLERLHRVLAPEGRLVTRVRARRTSDTSRLYDPETLRSSLEVAGFRTQTVRYWNFLGVPWAWATARRRDLADGAGEAAVGLPSHWWDQALDWWFEAVENRVGFPTGVSLISVATPHVEKVRVRRESLSKALGQRGTREAYEPMAASR